MPRRPRLVATGPHVRLRLASSPRGGLGVVVDEDVRRGAVVEAAPVLAVSDRVADELPDRCVVVSSRGRERYGVPLGYVGMVNHDADPTCDWQVRDLVMVLTARRRIHAGEELTIDYGADWFPSRGLDPV